MIAEVLRQISLSKTSVLDLRTQVADCQSAASQSHNLLQAEVDSYRDRKRQEDASKLELKTRTKVLDDSKRGAESTKRDAEKRLKAAQNARDNANQRMTYLDEEIARLQQRLIDDETCIRQCKEGASDAEKEVSEALEDKRQEIKAAEDIIVDLSLRAKELEDRLAGEKEKLRLIKERAESQRLEAASYNFQTSFQLNNSGNWSPVAYSPSFESSNGPLTPVASIDLREEQEASPILELDYGTDRRSSFPRDQQIAPGPTTLNLNSISNFNSTKPTNSVGHDTNVAFRTTGYSLYDDGSMSLNQTPQAHVSTFSPFGDSDEDSPYSAAPHVSPGTSLIPTGLIESDSVSRSFQSENDIFLDREWRASKPSLPYQLQTGMNDTAGYTNTTVTSSPISPHGPSANDFEYDFRSMVQHDHDNAHERQSELSLDMQRASWFHRTHSAPNHPLYETDEVDESHTMTKAGPRRWFSTASKEKPKKGLNPDAKVFNISRKSAPCFMPSSAVNQAYDALNPNGLGANDLPATSNSLLRAFAPSRAEREALQRALGGSTNTSFERLPSLSDVGSLPSSPQHVHAHAAVQHIPQHSAREMGKVLPSWLQSLPRIHKAKFSPWDDEDSEVGNNSNASSAVSAVGNGVQRKC